MNNKLLAIFAIAALLAGVLVASVSFTTNAHADKTPFTGPGGSDQVSSHSYKHCLQLSPGNSPCR